MRVVRFMQCCSLAQLLNTMTKADDAKQSDSSSCSDSGAVLVKVDATSDVALKAKLAFNQSRYTFSNCGKISSLLNRCKSTQILNV